jgi:hypothetical protein
LGGKLGSATSDAATAWTDKKWKAIREGSLNSVKQDHGDAAISNT